MSDMDRARALLDGGEYTCVLCCGERTYTAVARGVAPLLDWLEIGADMSGFVAADRVVGKAAALLYVLLHVKAVYAPVMSAAAETTLRTHGIETAWDTLVPAIRNRLNTGLCPMEQTVADIDDPQKARKAIAAKRRELQAKKPGTAT